MLVYLWLSLSIFSRPRSRRAKQNYAPPIPPNVADSHSCICAIQGDKNFRDAVCIATLRWKAWVILWCSFATLYEQTLNAFTCSDFERFAKDECIAANVQRVSTVQLSINSRQRLKGRLLTLEHKPHWRIKIVSSLLWFIWNDSYDLNLE